MHLVSPNICDHGPTLCVCVFFYLNSNEKSKVYVRLVFSLNVEGPMQSVIISKKQRLISFSKGITDILQESILLLEVVS